VEKRPSTYLSESNIKETRINLTSLDNYKASNVKLVTILKEVKLESYSKFFGKSESKILSAKRTGPDFLLEGGGAVKVKGRVLMLRRV